MGDKTLGGIGRLFINDKLLTEVYYCVRQDRPNAPIYGSIVFLTAGIEVPNDTNCISKIIVAISFSPSSKTQLSGSPPTLVLQTMAPFIQPESHPDLAHLLQHISQSNIS
jgi:hypothetical protein